MIAVLIFRRSHYQWSDRAHKMLKKRTTQIQKQEERNFGQGKEFLLSIDMKLAYDNSTERYIRASLLGMRKFPSKASSNEGHRA